MNDDLSWTLRKVLEVPGARHAILTSDDGLLRATAAAPDNTYEMNRDMAETAAAAITTLCSLSRATIPKFFPERPAAWERSLIGAPYGWIALMSVGNGTCLAVSASDTVDMEALIHGMESLASRLNEALGTPLRTDSNTRA